jgi:uncharacterized protein YukJ
MPLKSYGVLAGRPVDRRLGTGQNPHYQIHVVDDETDYRIAVNVQSKESPSEVEYRIDQHFEHPLLTDLAKLSFGWHPVPSKAGGVAIDFIRANVADRTEFVPLPFNVTGPENDLNEKVDAQVQRAMGDENAVLYAFGERWGPEKNVKDKIFGFKPGNGVHDIHMNQGNVEKYKKDDGVWQDGAVLIHYPTSSQWVAIFLKFQSQVWHTDDKTGHRLNDEVQPPTPQPTTANPDGIVRIVAALVNSQKSPEIETVTLVNSSPLPIDLGGWHLADKQKKRLALKGIVAAGAAMQITIKKPMELSNQGGIITLLNEDGLKVDGVSYTRAQASSPGWTIVF